MGRFCQVRHSTSPSQPLRGHMRGASDVALGTSGLSLVRPSLARTGRTAR
jgi:hypothetical protein